MPLSRRSFLQDTVSVGFAASASGLLRAQEGKTGGERLNVLYIMTDQQPLGGAQGYGNEVVKTPGLATLARNGCTFDNLYIAAFPCSPSRACQLSGRYLHNHRVITNDVLLSQDIPCLGSVLQTVGYETGYFGKWHLGGNMYVGRRRAKTLGHSNNWNFQLLETETGWETKQADGGKGEDSPQHGFSTWQGGWKHYHQWLRERGKEEYLKKYPSVGNHNDAPSGREGTHIFSQLGEEDHMAAFFTEKTEEFIQKNQGGDKPWCAVLSYFGPHLPVAPPKPWDTMYSLEQVSLPENHLDSLEDKPFRQKGKRTYKQNEWNAEQYKDYIRRYWGYCSYIDSCVSRVLDTLKKTGQWEQTIVVFTSDHGDMVGAHGMVYKLGSCGYEELFHVPGFIRIPGVTRDGSRCENLVSQVDLFPTILEATGTQAPAGLDGASVVNLLRGTAQKHRESVFSDVANRSIVCRHQQHKFVLNWAMRDLDELYDLRSDPGEMRNLAVDPEHADLVKGMKKRIFDWLRLTKHPYANLIMEKAKLDPLSGLMDMIPRVSSFTYLGKNEFSMQICWKVKNLPKLPEGKFWAFTQFLNKKYATDGSIVFRFTPFPDPPLREWKNGEEYCLASQLVKVPKHAGSGKYTIRCGFYDPQQHKSAGRFRQTFGTFVELGTLEIRRQKGEITDISLLSSL